MTPEPLRLESVLVVLVDMAEGPLSSVHSMAQAELRANAGGLAELCVLLEIPVIVAHAPLGEKAGQLLPEVAAFASRFTRVDHASNDSWQTAAFVEAVKKTGRTQLIFAGIALDVGVGLTALSAQRAGYQTAVLVDVAATTNKRAEQAAWHRLASASVILTTWSAFAGEVVRNYTEGKGPQTLRLLAQHIFKETAMPGASEG